MNAKTQIIALAVRLLSENTNIIRKPDPMSELFSTIFGGETYDVRTAKQIEGVLGQVADTAKKMDTRRRFNKIVKKVTV